jgi:ferritin-like protein
MLKHIDINDFRTAFLTLEGKIIVEFYDYANQNDGTTFRFVEQQEYDYSIGLVQELDELFDFDIQENIEGDY